MDWGDVISLWEAYQYIWSHWTPESRHACSLLIQSHPLRVQREDLSIWMTAFKNYPHCSNSACFFASSTIHNCHFEKKESLNPQQRAQRRLECRDISMKLLQQTSRSCRISINHGHFSTSVETFQCFSMPEHTYRCLYIYWPFHSLAQEVCTELLVPRRKSSPASSHWT